MKKKSLPNSQLILAQSGFMRGSETIYPAVIEQCYFILAQLREVIGNRCVHLNH